MWEQKIKCVKCKHFLKIGEYDTSTRCENCGQEYNTIDDELYHATACSATSVYYEVNDSWQVKRIHFHNQPIDLLDETVQNSRMLVSEEKDPHILTKIVKKYYDALKKRLQSFLTLGNIPNLSAAEKNSIDIDTPTYSILHLIDILKKAFPGQLKKIQEICGKHETTIKRIKWIRDKSEHPLMKLWSIPGKIYEDRSDQPNSKNPPKEYLNYNFIIKTNRAVIDVCLLLLKLDPVTRPKDQYDVLEGFRITT